MNDQEVKIRLENFSNQEGDAKDNDDSKHKFIFYLRISRYSNVIYFVYHCQNYQETESGKQR